MKHYFLFLFSLLSGITASASDTIPVGPFHYIDSIAAHAPDTLTPEPKYIAAYLKKYCETDMDRARAAYTWTATHIAYDVESYNAGRKTDQSCDRVLQRGLAVCQGFANVYQMLCTYMGLEAAVIHGFSKGYSYEEGDQFEGRKTNHAWNAVRVDGRWLLIDATWGSGFGRKVEGRMEGHRRFEPYWFDTDPYEFAFAHYSSDTQWLLLPARISLRQFEDMPRVRPTLFKLGFSGRVIYEQYMAGTLPDPLPTAYATRHRMRLVDFPLSGTLRAGSHVNLTIVCDEDLKILAVAERGAHPVAFVHTGNVYRLSAPLMRGSLKIGIGMGKKLQPVLAYIVK